MGLAKLGNHGVEILQVATVPRLTVIQQPLQDNTTM